jgi:hypothetical protein
MLPASGFPMSNVPVSLDWEVHPQNRLAASLLRDLEVR